MVCRCELVAAARGRDHGGGGAMEAQPGRRSRRAAGVRPPPRSWAGDGVPVELAPELWEMERLRFGLSGSIWAERLDPSRGSPLEWVTRRGGLGPCPRWREDAVVPCLDC